MVGMYVRMYACTFGYKPCRHKPTANAAVHFGDDITITDAVSPRNCSGFES